MPAFSVPVDNTGTSAVTLVTADAASTVRVDGFALTPLADVEVRFRDSDSNVLATFLLSKGIGLADTRIILPAGKGLQVITITSVRLTGVVWGATLAAGDAWKSSL